MNKQDYVSLENLGSGAAAEMFAAELERVIENISDPNTKPDLVRNVTLTLKVKPNKERSFCATEIECKCKLAPALPYESQMFIGMEKGKARATEYNPQQGKLFEGTTIVNDEGEEVDVATGQIVGSIG